MNSNQDSNQGQITVFGSIVQDIVSYVERFPRPGESIRGNSIKLFCGGKGSNQAAMAAKLGSKVKMVGMVGADDVFADFNRKSLNSYGVDTGLVFASATGQSTATATITVNSDGENSIVVCLGSNMELSSQHAKKAENEIAKSKIVMCQSEVDQAGNLEAFRIARQHGVLTFFNPAPGRPDLDMRIVALTDIICTNENEAEFVTGMQLKTQEEFEEAAKKILELGPRAAIVTLGPKGVIVAQRTKENGKTSTVSYIKTEKVEAVDTVGAGDCFCGSLAHFLASNPDGDLVKFVEMASKIATISVQRHGAQVSYPTREELVSLNVIPK